MGHIKCGVLLEFQTVYGKNLQSNLLLTEGHIILDFLKSNRRVIHMCFWLHLSECPLNVHIVFSKCL